MLGIKNKSAFKTIDFYQNFTRSNQMEFTLNAQTQAIFDNMFAFFGTLTPEGNVLSLRGKVFERTATDPQLIVGQKFSETVYWQSTEHTSIKFDKAVEKAAQGKKRKTSLDFRVNADEKISIELSLNPIIGDDRKIDQIFFCALEVTDREREIEYYKERSEQLLYAAENAEIGLWYWDLAKNQIDSTPKCNELFEVSPHGIITLDSFLEIVHPEDRFRVETALRHSQKNGTQYNAEYRVIYADGTIHWISARGKTFLDAEGNPKNMMGVVQKITENKIAAEELAEVFAREKKARDEAEEANRAKDFFLAVVSHELRSPLNAILGWTKVLLTKEVNEETRINALKTIEQSARSQTKLINDLIDSARVASGRLRLEMRPINLYETVKTVYNLQTPAAEAKNINLEFATDQEDITVFGDTVRLQQVFSNLLSNAIKFTDEGGTIKINVQTGQNDVKIAIKDNGQGISPSALPKIFRQFRQGDEKTSLSDSGLGLGLSIAKILTEKHNGQVQATSDGIGHGATFTITLPLCGLEKDVATERGESISQEEKILDGIKILIVEDDPDSREVLQLILEQSGAIVGSAGSAEEAMTLLRVSLNDLPNVIVSDIGMPNEDGYSLIGRIRQLAVECGGTIPALALSAFASSENKNKAYLAGFQKYHTKPFDPDRIIEDIRQLLD